MASTHPIARSWRGLRATGALRGPWLPPFPDLPVLWVRPRRTSAREVWARLAGSNALDGKKHSKEGGKEPGMQKVGGKKRAGAAECLRRADPNALERRSFTM